MSQNIRISAEVHDALNPKLWEGDEMLLDVRIALLKSALAFYEFLDIPGLELLGVHFTGSNASFNYTEYSDCDIHLIVDYDTTPCPELAENLFTTKKTLWNRTHDRVTVKGYKVELYVEDVNNPVKAAGVYDLLAARWIKFPKYDEPEINTKAVKAKVISLANEIEEISTSGDRKSIDQMFDRLKVMRKAGLARAGEFSVENLAFKSLRNLGYLDQLSQARLDSQDAELTLEVNNQIDELARPPRKSDVSDILSSAGYQLLGAGVYGDVWGKPGADYVLKLFDHYDRAYLRFINLAKQNPSPYFPRFKGKPMRVSEEYYGVRLEKLEGHASVELSKVIHDYVATRKYYVSDENIRRSRKRILDQMLELDQKYPGIKRACDLIADEYGQGEKSHIDIHNENIMFRGSTPVIIDPAS